MELPNASQDNRSSIIETATRSSYIESETGCNLLPSQNSSLAASWENIPETVLLNGSIGLFLFTLFVILTKIAWRHSHDSIVSQNIVSLLYGYRDPEHWYIIPRFEFLRREERHHHHDLKYPYIYVPPKLPLANPIELFAYESDIERSGSAESIQGNENETKPPITSTKRTIETSKSDQGAPNRPDVKESNQTLKTIESRASNSSIKQASSIGDQSQSTSKELPPKPTTPKDRIGPKYPLGDANESEMPPTGSALFYPSVLTAEQLQASYLSRKLNRFFSIFYNLTDADIIYIKGIDAYEYLLFQRHLILIMFITNILCLCLILPIHWLTGTNVDQNTPYSTSFQRSTIKNMTPNSHLYWAHIISSTIIVICTVLVMKSYKESIITRDDTQLSRRTLLIGNIPVEQRSRVKLLSIMEEHFPKSSIEAIQFVYDTKLLARYEADLSSVIVARSYCQLYRRENNRELMVHTTDVDESRTCNGYCRLCSFFYVCCRHWLYETKEPGSSYYAKQEEKYRDKIREVCEKLVEEPTEYAFVTFKSYRQAKRVLRELAQIKQESLEDKQSIYGGPGRFKSKRPSNDSIDSTGFSSRKQRTKKELELKGKLPMKYIEAANESSSDPLDPTNNPHVRSIRSPIEAQRSPMKGKKLPQVGPQVGPQVVPSAAAAAKQPAPRKTQGEASKQLESPLAWSVRYAPHPDNVEFSDLLGLARISKYTIGLLHVLMIIIFIFITTPNVVLSVLERLSAIRPDRAAELTGFQAMLINWFSILLQIITTALLPALVTQISKQIPYEDTSSKDHSVMWKVYLFLVLMIIIMPSVGMSSAQAFLNTDIDPKCLFPTDNGAYFINYVISSIFLSTMLELIKPVDILSYYFILLTSRSQAEFEGGRQFIEREFSVGLQHTSVLLIFSVVMTYSISCPLIAPVGLVYLIIKHSVDHYHLYYTYFTRKVDKNLQATIVIFVKSALLLMLFQTTIAISINTGTSYFSFLSQIVFWITLAGFVFNCFFDCTSRAIPRSNQRSRYQHEFCACFYLPRVIENLLRCNAIPIKCISRKV